MAFKSPYRMFPHLRSSIDAGVGNLPLTYIDKMLEYGPIAYFPMTETSGTTAVDLIQTPAQNGTYARDVSVMGTQIGIGDGNTAPTFDGSNDLCQIYSASLNAAFDTQLGTIHLWLNMASGGWTGAGERYGFYFVGNSIDFQDLLRIGKAAENLLQYTYIGQGTAKAVNKAYSTVNTWFAAGITWDVSGDEVKAYFNGTQEGLTQTPVTGWTQSLANGWTTIGALGNGTLEWIGGIAHFAIWDSVLSPAQMADLAIA